MFNKILTIILGFSIFTFSFVNYTKAADAKTDTNPPSCNADSIVLMDVDSGDILYSKNPTTAYPMASTTKILTTLITLEKCKLTDEITIGKKPPNVDGSKMGMFTGEVLTVEDLLYGLLLNSGNDCSLALAEHISGSEDKFVELMNKRAAELGCKDCNFVNSSGLYDKNHKASAKDMVLILKELSRHPEFSRISKTVQFNIPPTNKTTIARNVWNEDKFVRSGSSDYYKYVLAAKTGYTTQSQYSFVAIAQKDGRTLLLAIIHNKDNTHYKDAAKFFDYGFNNFEDKKIINKGDVVKEIKLGGITIPLVADSDFIGSIKLNTSNSLSTNVKLDYLINRSNFKKGEKIGEADVYYSGSQLGSVKLVSGVDHIVDPAESQSPQNSANFVMVTTASVGSSLVIAIIFGLLIIKETLQKN